MALTRRVAAFCATWLVAVVVVFAAMKLKHIASDPSFGCTTKDQFGKLVGYLVQGDKEAFAHGLGEAVAVDKWTLFKKDEPVYVTDTEALSGLVKVRRKGEKAEYWTNIEAVK